MQARIQGVEGAFEHAFSCVLSMGLKDLLDSTKELFKEIYVSSSRIR